MNDEIIVCEISGRRAGGDDKRPTERLQTKHRHLIVSNNSEGYETDWEIVNVPDDYWKWYEENVKSSDKLWMAQMNRSYALKYAKDHGYRYCVQLDDNIRMIEFAYRFKDGDVAKAYRSYVDSKRFRDSDILDDVIEMLVTGLKETDAGVAGCSLASVVPDNTFMAERYVYSLFAVDVERCPDHFQGDFEDDIEYRLKLKQMGRPVICFPWIRYSKISQRKTGDNTGCRQAYNDAGVTRGEHMSMIYGDMYSAGISIRGTASNSGKIPEGRFLHKLKPFKIGVTVKDMDAIKDKAREILKKRAKPKEDKIELMVKGDFEEGN